MKASGAEAYRERLEKAPAYFHWLADRARAQIRHAHGRRPHAGLQVSAPAIQRIPDRLERFAVANDVADYLGVDEKLVREHFSKGVKEPSDGPRRPEAPPTERLLLHSLLASEAARSLAIPELRDLPAVDRFVTRNIFKALFAMHSDGTPFRFADLEGRLSETDRDLLSSIVFADEVLEEEKAAEQARACLRSLKSQDPRSRRPPCAPGSKQLNAREIFRKRCDWPKSWIEKSRSASTYGNDELEATARELHGAMLYTKWNQG